MVYTSLVILVHTFIILAIEEVNTFNALVHIYNLAHAILSLVFGIAAQNFSTLALLLLAHKSCLSCLGKGVEDTWGVFQLKYLRKR